MTAETFESNMRSSCNVIHSAPSRWKWKTGDKSSWTTPEALSFGGGCVGFIGPEPIYLLRCENVRAIRPDVQEATP
jgi:hypothetical protein